MKFPFCFSKTMKRTSFHIVVFFFGDSYFEKKKKKKGKELVITFSDDFPEFHAKNE